MTQLIVHLVLRPLWNLIAGDRRAQRIEDDAYWARVEAERASKAEHERVWGKS